MMKTLSTRKRYTVHPISIIIIIIIIIINIIIQF